MVHEDVLGVIDKDIFRGEIDLQLLVLGESAALGHVGFQPSEVEYHAGAYQGGGDPDIDPPLAEDGVVDLLGDTVPYRYRRIVVLEGTVRLQGDVVLRDIVDPGQEG